MADSTLPLALQHQKHPIDPLDPELPVANRLEMSLEAFRQMEDEILTESAEILHGSLAFADVEVDNLGNVVAMPDGWVEKYGEEMAKKRLRLAKYALMSTKDAPVGLKIAQATYIGIQRVRAADRQLVGALNVGTVIVTVTQNQYPEMEVEERK